MKKIKYIIILVALVCGLVIAPNNGFAQLTWADAFITPNAGTLYNGLGAFVGGDVPGSFDWTIGNRCPSGSATTKDMVFSTANYGGWYERMRLTKGGDVGVGTTSPVSKIEVVDGDLGAKICYAYSATPPVLAWYSLGVEGSYLDKAKGRLGYRFSSLSSYYYGVYGSATSEDGVNYGVYGYATGGTTNWAGYFKGNVNVDGSIYQSNSVLHADYVFEEDYKLESIEEHAKYMWTEKHLKAIPKAEKDKSGQEVVEVGAHRKGIVEELEKAHIYIEQLHKEIKEMKAELKANKDLRLLVSELQSQIKALETKN
jgi:hypothetical protein